MFQPKFKNVKAAAKHEAVVRMTHVPRCPACFAKDGTITPNPLALENCPVCAAPQPIPNDKAGQAVLPQPFLTRVCYGIADFIMRLANSIGEPT